MSTNIWADLEFDNPQEMQLKTNLVIIIADIFEANKMTQAQLAKKVGMTQPMVSRMLRNITDEVSVERLLEVLKSLGHSFVIVVDTRISEAPTSSVQFRELVAA